MKVKTNVSLRVKQDWRAISNKFSQKIADRLNVAALNTQAEAKLSMKPGDGREYKRGGVTHTASSAGNAPAVDTGRLRDSINVIKFATISSLESEVGTNVEYAPFLEYGTSKMRPRPFWNPAIEKARKKLIEQLRALRL